MSITFCSQYAWSTNKSDTQYMIQLYEQDTQFFTNDLVMIALLAGSDYDVRENLYRFCFSEKLMFIA